jgi:hypothetical protein
MFLNCCHILQEMLQEDMDDFCENAMHTIANDLAIIVLLALQKLNIGIFLRRFILMVDSNCTLNFFFFFSRVHCAKAIKSGEKTLQCYCTV